MVYFTGGSQKKIYDFPLTLSGFTQNTESCLTFIELPEIFDNQDIISTTEHVKNRCFDRIIVHIDARYCNMGCQISKGGSKLNGCWATNQHT